MTDTNQQLTDTQYSGGDILKEFQLADLSIEEKSKSDFGKKISQKIWGYIISGFGGYYYQRNSRFLTNRNWAHGRVDIQRKFQDRFEFNAKQNYIRLVWNTLQIPNRIISGLVGKWMQRNEKVVVKATDDLSQKDKQEEYEQIKFIIENRAKLEQLQQASGVQMIPNKDLPRDKEELNLWQQQFQRIPEEIIQELGCNEVLGSNGWYDVLKEFILHDSAEVGLVCSETYMDREGVIHTPRIKSENAIYSASDFPDFRDWSWLGHAPDMKISELRKDYGKEFNPNNPNALSEEQIWTVAQTAKEYKSVTNLNWDFNADWQVPFSLRPYDEWNVRSIHFDLKSVDVEPFTVTKTPFNKTYTRKGSPIEKQNKWSTTELISDTNINIYHGVYLPDNDILLEWGLAKNLIRPQDPKEAGSAESRYSFYMYQNYQMRNLAIPEKIEAAVDGMILALLKIQQIVARLVPSGYAIDETKLNDIDYGLGDANKNIDHAQLYFQTGLLYYSSVDGEGIRDPNPPIKELANNGFVGQMQGLIQNYQFWYQTLKDELGEDPNLNSAALRPRVTAQNVEVSQSQSDYATDYMYRAYVELTKMTARKVSCLLKDSVMYGSQAYRDLMKDTDVDNRIFSTDIKFLPTEQEIAQFDAILQNAINSTPELAMFLNQLQAMEMVKQDVKLGWIYYNQCIKKMILWKNETAQQNQQATFQAQLQSGVAAEQERRKTMQAEVSTKGMIDMGLSKEKQKEIILTGIFGIYAKGLQMPPELKTLETEMINNVAVPLFAQNVANAEMLMQAAQNGGQQMQDNQQQQPQQMQEQPNQSQPPPQVAA